MLINATIEEKQVGHKQLLNGIHLQLQEGEVVGFVGRNGVGKTTLTRILTGEDKEFIGQVEKSAGLIIVSTEQEQDLKNDGISTIDYVLDGLRDYRKLTKIIEQHPETMGEDMNLIGEYSDALESYEQLGYYHVRDQVVESLRAYQLSGNQISGPLSNLSGGQKRFAQLVQIEYSNADLLILDEPTNHMDYLAKQNFVSWLKSTPSAVLVITHDRDVLSVVDRIIELKDHKLMNFPGNYEAYLKQNASTSTSAMHQYEVAVKTLANRQEALKSAQIKKSRSKQSPNPFVPLVRRLEKEIEKLEATISKPTIWIDQASIGDLKSGQSEQYLKYKTKNINLRGARQLAASQTTTLVSIEDLSLGFDKPLFEHISFQLRAGERTHIIGRNGAGKTTLVDAICDVTFNQSLKSKIFAGLIEPIPKLVIGRYEQELAGHYLDDSLAEAITKIYRLSNVTVNEEVIAQVLNEFLFERHDGGSIVRHLSGGQKARLQIIALFANRPNLLILDEPTNHLDLPSIEELENALLAYQGAILYISHDSYFAQKLGGESVQIGINK